MDTKLKQAIVEAKHYVYQIHDCCHNSVHVEAVVSFAERIAKNHPGVRKDVVEVAAWWHDVGRLYSEDHEEISASMAQKALRKIGIEPEFCHEVYRAIVNHRYSMQPDTLEGEIIRDADKLDFLSPKRWRCCLGARDPSHLGVIVDVLPKLRDEVLHLSSSRKIYDEIYPEFIQFVEKMPSSIEGFRRIREEVLNFNYNSEFDCVAEA